MYARLTFRLRVRPRAERLLPVRVVLLALEPGGGAGHLHDLLRVVVLERRLERRRLRLRPEVLHVQQPAAVDDDLLGPIAEERDPERIEAHDDLRAAADLRARLARADVPGDR
jgi:hypothetical protein